MAYYEEVNTGEMRAFTTNTAVIGRQDPDETIPQHHVVLILDLKGSAPNAAWKGRASHARQLAAALLNTADKADKLNEQP